MNKLRHSSNFVKNGLVVLLVLVVLMESLAWSVNYENRMKHVDQIGGFGAYFSFLVRRFLLPESITVLILTMLMEGTRRWFNLTAVPLTWRSLIYYQLSFLPVMILAYGVSSPFAQTARYLLTTLPPYSLSVYWTHYLLGPYSWHEYVGYLGPLLFIGYCTLNRSLLSDYRQQSRLSTLE
jgi:hypothetical protein